MSQSWGWGGSRKTMGSFWRKTPANRRKGFHSAGTCSSRVRWSGRRMRILVFIACPSLSFVPTMGVYCLYNEDNGAKSPVTQRGRRAPRLLPLAAAEPAHSWERLSSGSDFRFRPCPSEESRAMALLAKGRTNFKKGLLTIRGSTRCRRPRSEVRDWLSVHMCPCRPRP